jgi:hypothetical protein
MIRAWFHLAPYWRHEIRIGTLIAAHRTRNLGRQLLGRDKTLHAGWLTARPVSCNCISLMQMRQRQVAIKSASLLQTLAVQAGNDLPVSHPSMRSAAGRILDVCCYKCQSEEGKAVSSNQGAAGRRSVITAASEHAVGRLAKYVVVTTDCFVVRQPSLTGNVILVECSDGRCGTEGPNSHCCSVCAVAPNSGADP